jgi:hypothetical protein
LETKFKTKIANEKTGQRRFPAIAVPTCRLIRNGTVALASGGDGAEDVLAVERPVRAAVIADESVVAHEEKLLWTEGQRVLADAAGEGAGVFAEVRFVDGFSVENYGAMLERDGVVRKGDDAFHDEFIMHMVADDDEVAVVQGEETVRPPIQEIDLTRAEGGFHAETRDGDGGDDEIGDEKETEDRPEGHAKEDVALPGLRLETTGEELA